MAAIAKNPKATAKAAKGKQKNVAAPAKKAPRVRKAARAETGAPVETLPAVARVANAELPVQALEAAPMAETLPQAGTVGNDDRILLPARMELASLDEAHQLLQSKYPPFSSKFILDGGLLSVIDSAGIQMLISFIRSVTARGCQVEWDNYSVQVYQLASELGVASQLGD